MTFLEIKLELYFLFPDFISPFGIVALRDYSFGEELFGSALGLPMRMGCHSRQPCRHPGHLTEIVTEVSWPGFAHMQRRPGVNRQ